MEESSTIEAENTLAGVDAAVTVHAFLVPGTTEVLFALGDGKGLGKQLPPGVTRKGNTIEFEKTNGTIAYELDDHSGLKLGFITTDPIWSCTGTDCPTSPGNQLFPVVNCSDKKLTITNNGTVGEFAYTLRFADKDGYNQQEFDPIIKNRL